MDRLNRRVLLVRLRTAVADKLGARATVKWGITNPSLLVELWNVILSGGALPPSILDSVIIAAIERRIRRTPKQPVGFTVMQMKVMLCLVRYALTDAELAAVLGVSVSAIKKHLQNIYQKLGFKETGAIGQTPRVRLAQYVLLRLLRPRRRKRRRHRFAPWSLPRSD